MKKNYNALYSINVLLSLFYGINSINMQNTSTYIFWKLKKKITAELQAIYLSLPLTLLNQYFCCQSNQIILFSMSSVKCQEYKRILILSYCCIYISSIFHNFRFHMFGIIIKKQKWLAFFPSNTIYPFVQLQMSSLNILRVIAFL